MFWAKITFVSNNDNWYPIGSLWGVSLYQSFLEAERTNEVVENLVPDDLDHLKRLHRGNGVDENIAVDPNEVLGVQDAVLIL